MPLLADLIAALAAGLLALLAARWFARSSITPERPTEEVARAVGAEVRQHSSLRRLVVRRLDPPVTTGLLLTLALALTLFGGLALGILAWLVRRAAVIQHVDNSVAAWGYNHRSPASTSGLKAITELGNIRIVIGLALVLVLLDVIRHRNRWSFLFLLFVLAGMEAIMLGVKDVVGRLRPTLNPAAAALGPSFPSGHSATAAAFYAAAALIIGRSLQRPVRQLVIGAAVALTVAVAASRVLLAVHWLSDVIGGLSLGWAWFALCAIVFGGRLLRPTAAADIASAQAAAPKHPPGPALKREPPLRTLASGSREDRPDPRRRSTGGRAPDVSAADGADSADADVLRLSLVGTMRSLGSGGRTESLSARVGATLRPGPP
jgi:membrane-associated phospholipid phosphatase